MRHGSDIYISFGENKLRKIGWALPLDNIFEVSGDGVWSGRPRPLVLTLTCF
jgi:hypothetical protein